MQKGACLGFCPVSPLQIEHCFLNVTSTDGSYSFLVKYIFRVLRVIGRIRRPQSLYDPSQVT
jgi:hypothetical protein